jgi:hypothetical protein
MSEVEEKASLKSFVRPIVLAQGNVYIKELLRSHKLPIGATKTDFEKNLSAAIGDGKLTRDMIEQWLLEVEGWGDQHVYLFEPPNANVKQLRAQIAKSAHAAALDVPVSFDFPAVLSLTAIRLEPGELSVDWHRGSAGWEREKRLDRVEMVEGDQVQFRAYRERMDRRVVRFEWRFDKPYCGIFTQLPNEGDLHSQTLSQAYADLQAMGVMPKALEKVPLSKAVKASSQDAKVEAKSTKMSAEGGYIDIVATVTEGGIGDVEPLRRARKGVQDSDFGSAEGVLSFRKSKHPRLSKDLKTTVYGSDGRFRVWAQCLRDDVYELADLLWACNR